MGRALRKRLLQTVDLMEQAIKMVDETRKERISDCVDLLSDCQELAVAFGTRLEKIYGLDTATVAALEQYCEAVYQMGNMLCGSSETKDPDCAMQCVKTCWEDVKAAFDEEVSDKKEIVFLPYKASMWDSLESVYLAAREDLECVAYCVPIPYYDKNSDGSFGEMHYEGSEYPKNIEITDWQQYDLEFRMPDEIYIHNPYDEFNLVTSVHPKYYAKNLKQYTEELEYIPYFVLDEIEPDNQEAIDKMKHFVWTPGVIFADKVIVQSEKMKQIYVNEYLKAAKENGMTGKHLDRRYLEKKILGSGSPKLEKIANTRKEDLDIPEEWLRIILKPDGTWKKIIFYNTAISGLLEHNEKWVDKLEDSLQIFKVNSERVALLWRPHPLIENTMKAMRPAVRKRYLELKKRYLADGWGIYDDSADLDRAVAISDAYYGDGSSVVQLYQKVGKPVMLQNVEIINVTADS